MKKKTITHGMLMILVGALLSTLTLLPISAGDTIFRASGTLDEYIAGDYDGALIVKGTWKVSINTDGELTFSAHYIEDNVNEEIIGTKDRFTLYYDEVTDFYLDESTLLIFQRPIATTKLGWDNPSNGEGFPPGPRYYKEYYMPVKISVTSDNIVIEIGGQPYIAGTTNAFK